MKQNKKGSDLMALLKCPECKHDVSDKASACPHCGYPINSPTSTKPRIRNGKPTKLPNGYGTIYKLPGKRSKPFRAVKTDKWVLDAATGKIKRIVLHFQKYTRNGMRDISLLSPILPVSGLSQRHTLIVTVFMICG